MYLILCSVNKGTYSIAWLVNFVHSAHIMYARRSKYPCMEILVFKSILCKLEKRRNQFQLKFPFREMSLILVQFKIYKTTSFNSNCILSLSLYSIFTKHTKEKEKIVLLNSIILIYIDIKICLINLANF